MPSIGHYLWCAFGAGPLNYPYDYKDITPYLLDEGGAASRRGRQNTTQKTNTGRGTFALDNRNLQFEALNSASPYFGQLVPDKPVQSGVMYPWLPGLLNNSALKTTPVAWTLTACTRSYTAPIDALQYGSVRITQSTVSPSPGIVVNPLIVIPVARQGGPIAIGVNVKGTYTPPGAPYIIVGCTFYTDVAGTTVHSSVTVGSAYTFLNTPTRAGGTTVVPVGALSMRVTFQLLGPAGIYWDLSCIVVDYAGLYLFEPAYSGYSDAWDCEKEVGNTSCVLQCSDGQKALGLMPLSTPLYGNYLSGLAPKSWFRLDERVLSQADIRSMAFKDQVSGLLSAHVAGDPNFVGGPGSYPARMRGAGPLAGVAGCSPVDNDLAFSLVGPSSTDGGFVELPAAFLPQGDNWTIGFWWRSTNGTLYDTINPTGTGSGDQSVLSLLYTPGGERIEMVLRAATGTFVCNSSVTNSAPAINGLQDVVVDTLWHRVIVTYTKTGNSLKVYIDGILDHTEPSSGTGHTLPAPGASTYSRLGAPGQLNPDAIKGGQIQFMEIDELSSWQVALSAGTITTDYQKAKLTYPPQKATDRVTSVLNNVGWPAALRDITASAGPILNGVKTPFYLSNPLSYLQLVETSEQAFLLISKNGKITYVNLSEMLDATTEFSVVQAAFGNVGSEIPYEVGKTSNSDDTLYTQVNATNEGGTLQRYDSPAEADFFTRSLSVTGLLLDLDEKAYNIAFFLGTLFSRPATRLNTITFNPYLNEASLLAYTKLELGRMISVRLPLAGATSVVVNCNIQSIGTDVNRNRMRCTLGVSDIYSQRWMNFGDNFSSYNMGL